MGWGQRSTSSATHHRIKGPTMADPIVWPSVTPVPFTDDDATYWRDGKPWCATHHRCVVPASTSGSVASSHYPTDGGTHLCPNCMREHLDSITHHQEATL